uniref:Amaranthin-like lectin n=1 Tax=Linum usitatissimum TaxID=4006 RepID=A0A097PIC0_LINUS|nr:amaranthin-like lectin [Linum usitatissimum]
MSSSTTTPACSGAALLQKIACTQKPVTSSKPNPVSEKKQDPLKPKPVQEKKTSSSEVKAGGGQETRSSETEANTGEYTRYSETKAGGAREETRSSETEAGPRKHKRSYKTKAGGAGEETRSSETKAFIGKGNSGKSMYNDKYLSYREDPGKEQDGFLQFSGNDPMSPYSKFEVKMSATETGSFHLMCSLNNKYLVRTSPSQHWIRGSNTRPEEDKSKWSCTLFKPIPVDDHNGDGNLIVVRFLHVQLNHYACLFRSGPPFGDCLFAGWKSPNQDLCDACSVIDWESLHQIRVGDSSQQVTPKPEPSRGKEIVDSNRVSFNIISSADKFWGAVFASTKILPKALPQAYKAIKVMKGDGFSQGSVREITFGQGDVEKLEEKISYVDHETKTMTWSLIQGGMLNHYETFKITITVAEKKRHDRGCRVNWSYVGTNPKPGFDKDALMELFQDTFETVDDYLEANEARD